MYKFLLLVISITFSISSYSQTFFSPGFNKNEVIDAMKFSAHFYSVEKRKTMDMPEIEANDWELIHSSEKLGLDNKWEFWYSKNKNACAISIRGTIKTMTSWMEDFYSGMIKAQGEIQIDSNRIFKYKFAEDTTAYVHVGWTIGIGFLQEEIVSKIKEYYEKGVRNFYISGHSQGAALATLLTSFLHYHPTLPKDIQYKTYALAAPKPGNLSYSYDFSSYTQEGWAYRIVNTLDWVPETPLTIQVIDDVSAINPFVTIEESTKSLGKLERLIILSVYGKMSKKLTKAQEYMTKYLGYKVHDFVLKDLPNLEQKEFKKSFEYSTCGTQYVLVPTKDDLLHFEDPDDSFTHHHVWNYYYIFKKFLD